MNLFEAKKILKLNGYKLINENTASGVIEKITKIMTNYANDDIDCRSALINIINIIQSSKLSRFLTRDVDVESINTMVRGTVQSILEEVMNDLENKRGKSEIDVLDNVAYRLSYLLT